MSNWADIAERTMWTFLQSGIAVTIVVSAHLSPSLTVLLTGVLALLKSYAATRLSVTHTAGTLPPSLTPIPDAIAVPSASGQTTTP